MHYFITDKDFEPTIEGSRSTPLVAAVEALHQVLHTKEERFVVGLDSPTWSGEYPSYLLMNLRPGPEL